MNEGYNGLIGDWETQTFHVFRYGARGRELIRTVGKLMVQGGGSFGTFMAVGTGIRC